jgi:hypothetical protein
MLIARNRVPFAAIALALSFYTSVSSAAAMSVAMQERIVCSIAAAQQYGLPANAMLAVAEQEGGRPGQAVRNTNGTFDLGALQFNTSYVRTLAKYGINPQDVQANGCYPYALAAWRIRRHVQFDRKGDFWTKVANYHSYTPVHNSRYRSKIIEKARRWHLWLNGEK